MSLELGMLLSLAIILLAGLIMAGVVVLLRNRGNRESERADAPANVSRKEPL